MNILRKEEAKVKIEKLVNHFSSEISVIKNGSDVYEATVEDNYVKPLFQYLNWNIHNEGLQHGREEFIVQYHLKRIGKKPDYLLRVPDISSGRMKHILFMEAKHPKYDLFNDIRWIRQCYLYSNSTLCKAEREERRVPLSILTDFEEFRLFDCRDSEILKLNTLDHFNKRAIRPFDNWIFHQYLTEFDLLWDVFEYSNVCKGSLDSYRVTDESLRDSRKAPDIDFLEILKTWRIDLAKDMYKNNHDLSEDVLTAASQLMVNRFVFLKMLSDKDLSADYLTRILDTVISSGKDDISFYDTCKNIFTDLHKTYNGSIFEQRTELDSVVISNKTIEKILVSLRPEKAIYSLDAMPVRVIGTMYEEFLGDIIKKVGRGIASEQKPEVRKAGGVYYTPEYIVDYIVNSTLGKLLENCKKPEDVSRLKICDPACGSGSFLIAVYEKLLDWHIEYYKTEIEKLRKKSKSWDEIKKKYNDTVSISLVDEEKGTYTIALTISLKSQIAKNSVFGVDIDQQAVEVTRFSICMKTVEDYQDKDELYREVDLFNTTILPDLTQNVKHGNSLINDGYFNQITLGIDEEIQSRKSIQPFNWNNQFKEIIDNGGFDLIIGNPPYFSIDDTWGKKDPRLTYIKDNYPEVYNDKTDILFYFICKAIKLSKNMVGYIISRAFLEAYKADKLRKYISNEKAVDQIIDFRNYYVFEGVGITSSILILGNKSDSPAICRKMLDNEKIPDLDSMKTFETIEISQEKFSSEIWSLSNLTDSSLLEKIDKTGQSIDSILLLGKGMETGDNNVFGKRSLEEIEKWGLKKGEYFIRARNSNIEKYSIKESDEYLIFIENYEAFKDLSSSLQEYLKNNSKNLKERAAYQRGNCEWWKYTWPLHKEYYSRKKILCPYMAKENRFAIDEDDKYLGLTDTTVLFDNGQPESLYYIIGLLNSNLLTYRFRFMSKLKSGGIYEYFWNNISKLPIKRIDFTNENETILYQAIESNVKKIMQLIEKGRTIKLQSDKIIYQGMIKKCEDEINKSVYKLYKITETEVCVIENR